MAPNTEPITSRYSQRKFWHWRCSLQYASIDDAARIISDLGPGTQLAKIDIAHAYRKLPVHPADRTLLGMKWKNKIYIDTVLPFGLRSVPKIFCAISDTLEWILHSRGRSACLHYINDFLTFGTPNSEQCATNLEILLQWCCELGIPLAIEKIEGPSYIIIFLGIELDTTAMSMRLPEEKQQHLQALIQTWLKWKAALKRDLLSLIGKLVHACKVVIPGMVFLRRMFDLASSCHKLDHWIRLNEGFCSARPIVVEYLNGVMKWGISPEKPHQPSSWHPCVHRCFRFMGVRSHIGQELVSVPLVTTMVNCKHSSKRARTHSSGHSSVG